MRWSSSCMKWRFNKNTFPARRNILLYVINKSSIDIILTFGDTIEYTLKELNDNFFYKKHFNDIELLKKKFKKIAKKNDLIYIKGSRSMQLERIYS